MRKNLESSLDELKEEDHIKLFRLGAAMWEHDETNDPIQKQRLFEEIRQLKKELIKLIPEFSNVEPLVAGDKDADKAELIVCADATSDAFRVKGTIEVPCSMCGRAVLLSPDSPKNPPKACYECALKRAEQMKLDDEQDSLGA